MVAYVAELRRLAESCNFGTTLDKMFRDQLVWGIRDDSIQKKLLQEKELTFQRALPIAQGSEAADRNLREMKAPKQKMDSNSRGITVKPEPVHKVCGKKPSTKDMGVTCHHCGTPGHLATLCRFRDRTCHKCGKEGTWRKCVGVNLTPSNHVQESNPGDQLHGQFGKLERRQMLIWMILCSSSKPLGMDKRAVNHQSRYMWR